MDKTELYIKIKVFIEKPLKAAVTLDDWKDVSIVNNFMNSLFKQIDIGIGGQRITQPYHTYPYKSHLEIKLEEAKGLKKYYLTSMYEMKMM